MTEDAKQAEVLNNELQAVKLKYTRFAFTFENTCTAGVPQLMKNVIGYFSLGLTIINKPEGAHLRD